MRTPVALIDVVAFVAFVALVAVPAGVAAACEDSTTPVDGAAVKKVTR